MFVTPNQGLHETFERTVSIATLFPGASRDIGPRLLSAIEDKVVKFVTRDPPQLFLEPEGTLYKLGVHAERFFQLRCRRGQSRKTWLGYTPVL